MFDFKDFGLSFTSIILRALLEVKEDQMIATFQKVPLNMDDVILSWQKPLKWLLGTTFFLSYNYSVLPSLISISPDPLRNPPEPQLNNSESSPKQPNWAIFWGHWCSGVWPPQPSIESPPNDSEKSETKIVKPQILSCCGVWCYQLVTLRWCVLLPYHPFFFTGKYIPSAFPFGVLHQYQGT